MKLSSDYLPMFSGYLPIFRRGTQLERRESSVNRQVILQNRQILPMPHHPCLIYRYSADFFGQSTDSLLRRTARQPKLSQTGNAGLAAHRQGGTLPAETGFREASRGIEGRFNAL